MSQSAIESAGLRLPDEKRMTHNKVLPRRLCAELEGCRLSQETRKDS
jgi:hypothetical protein